MYVNKTAITGAVLGSMLVAVPVFAQVRGQGEERRPQMPVQARPVSQQIRPMPVQYGERPQQQQGWRSAFQLMLEHMRMMPAETLAGTVTRVASPDFAIEIPARGRVATTTVTVTTNASTTFIIAGARGSFADVSLGLRASATGRYASTTQTLTAIRVALASTTPNNYGQQVRSAVQQAITERVGERLATTTRPAQIRGFIGGILEGLRNMFRF